MTFADVMDMGIADAQWFAERLHENREEEARQIRDATT